MVTIYDQEALAQSTGDDYNAVCSGQFPNRSCVTVERLIAAKKQAISDAQYELGLLQGEAFRIYKGCTYYHPITCWLDDARDWLSMERSNKDKDGNKLNRRKKYPQKLAFERLTSRLQRDILCVPDVEIQTIADYNFGAAYSIDFVSSGIIYNLTVPNASNIGFSYFEQHGKECFQLVLSCCTSDQGYVRCFDRVGCTFNINELSSLVQKGIKLADEEGDHNGNSTGI